LEEASSLKTKLTDALWFEMVWSKALAQAASETGLDVFSEVCPWVTDEILGQEF